MASAASSRHLEKLGQSLKSIIAYEPSSRTMQSPPYMSMFISDAAFSASALRCAVSNS